jgi:preprotein translocase subunit SecA
MTKSIERAQKKVEENNFGIRKRLLEYDDVMNSQREVIYKRRKNALQGNRLKLDIANLLYDTCEEIVTESLSNKDYKNYEYNIISTFSVSPPISPEQFENSDEKFLIETTFKEIYETYQKKGETSALQSFPVIKNVYENPRNRFEKIVVPFSDGNKSLNVVTNLEKAYKSNGKQLIDDFERNISLSIIDESWKNHLRKMDELKQSVQLAVHEQKDPLLIYKFESFELFKNMISSLNRDIISFLLKGNIPGQNPSIQEAKMSKSVDKLKTSKDDVLNSEELAAKQRAIGSNASVTNQRVETIVREIPKIGRNEKVKIRNVKNGNDKIIKFKIAVPLIKSGEWMLIEKIT